LTRLTSQWEPDALTPWKLGNLSDARVDTRLPRMRSPED
jgi:hypothetical protein